MGVAGQSLSPATSSPGNGSVTRCARGWMGPRVGVDEYGSRENLLPSPVFSSNTAVPVLPTLLWTHVLDLSYIIFSLAPSEEVHIYTNIYYDCF